MVGKDVNPLPNPGDEVLVAWGLGSVRGRVVDSYRGARPRVVVEIDPGQVDSESMTITVPTSAVEPGDSAGSPWAESARYDRRFAHALEDLLAGRLSSIKLDAPVRDREVDVVATLRDHRTLLVESKWRNRRLPASEIRGALSHLHALVDRESAAFGLFVTNQELPETADAKFRPRTIALRWRGEEDNGALVRVLARLFG